MKHNFKSSTYPLLLLIIISALANPLFAQQKAKKKWAVQKPFEEYSFIENKGQFGKVITDKVKAPILYYTKKGKVHIFYTPNSIVYGYDSLVMSKNDGDKNKGESDNEDKGKVTYYQFSMNWEGGNPTPTVEVQNPISSYYTFPNPADKSGSSGIKANAWSKIIYHNVYNGIDVEFYYPEDKGGMKYDVIVHPGADISSFKMKYSGATVKLTDNNITITSPFATFTDHEPSSMSGGDIMVNSSFKESDNIVSFNIGSYDKSKFLTIDPWTTTTAFSGYNEAYDLDYDNLGNVYIIGGGDNTEYQIQKYNSTGVLQWTYAATFAFIYSSSYYLYSDLTVDHRNGTSYFAEGGDIPGGCQVLKVNSAGIQKGLFAGSAKIQEMWRLAFDYCNNRLIIGGGNPTGAPAPAQACTLDTALTTIKAVNVLGATGTGTNAYYHDISLLALDGVGNAYMVSSKNAVSSSFDNSLIMVPAATLAPTAYEVNSGHNFLELESIAYYPSIGGPNFCANGMNGMAANKSMLLTYDGKELKKWRASTGAYVDSIKVSGTYFNWGGLDIDCAGNSYVGNNSQVNIYDSTLTPILTPVVTSNTIYDLRINGQGTLFTCGNGFVESDSVPSSKMASLAVTQPTSCSACNGSITASACGTAPFTYLWSNGATTQTISGLCDGSYTVTVKDAQCLPRIDTAVAFLGIPGYFATTTHVNPTCKVKGSATVNVTGGSSPYTYVWTDGTTNQQDTGLAAGTYTCVITDNNGCKLYATVRLVPPALPVIKVVPIIDSICPGGNINLTATGGNTYVWSPVTGLTCTTCPLTNASPTVATTYTVTATDTSGCVNTATTTISIAALPTITVTPPKDSICPGGSAVITGNGAVSYVWSPSTGLSCVSCTSPTATPTVKTTYTVTGTNATGCTNTGTVTITILPTPTVTVTPSKDSICSGATASLTASGGASYTWTPSFGLSSTNGATVTASPAVTTTYTVSASNGSCSHDTTVTVKVLTTPVIVLTPPSKICEGSDTTLVATGGGTYLWSTGQTTSSIQVAPTVFTPYTVSVTGADGCKNSATTAVAVDIPTLTVCCDTTIVKGTTVHLISWGNVVGYVWTPGSGLSCFTCPDPNANPTVNTTYTITGTDSNGCRVIQTVTIDMKCSDFTVPNVFTPNGDNLNDYFVISITEIDNYEITIYDRWGVEMFKSTDPYTYWDGKTKGGALAPDGVYYYIIKSNCGSNNYDKKGFVQIIR